ncbi:MAG: tRNA adenosine deaminase-associated protein, partial [Acidothermaceae bacterium]
HGQWKGADIELDDAEDIEDAADLMRDASVDDGPVLLFVEENDEWFGIVRVDGTGEPKAFISDARSIAASELAMKLFADLIPDEAVDDALAIDELGEGSDDVEDDDESSVKPAAEPAGSADLLSDLGVSDEALSQLCAEEGALPADVITTVCERLGCVDEIEVYR